MEDLLYKAALLDEKYPDRFCIRPLDKCPYGLEACNSQCWGYQQDKPPDKGEEIV